METYRTLIYYFAEDYGILTNQQVERLHHGFAS